MKKLLVLLLVFCLLLSAACAETAIFGDKMKVVNCKEYITLRERPETSAKAIAKIPLGDELTWFFCDYNDFSYVKYDGKVGFVLSKYLKPMPEEDIPPLTISVPAGKAPKVNYDIGSVYTVNETYLVDATYSEAGYIRTYLQPGDEVILREWEGTECIIAYNNMRMAVPEEILDIKEDYRGSAVNLSYDEAYRLNEFLSCISETRVLLDYYGDGSDLEYPFDIVEDFAVDFLRNHYPETVREVENDNCICGYYAQIEWGCIGSICDRFFYAVEEEPEYAWYEQNYAENQTEYYFIETGDSSALGFSCVDTVEALGDDRYAVRFHVYTNWDNEYDPDFNDDDWYAPVWNSNNCHLTPAQAASIDDPFCSGFAIIHAPDGLESSRNWTIEYYVMG